MKRNRKGIYTAITAGLFAGALVLSAGVLAQDGNLMANTNAITVQQSTAVATFAGGTATSGGQIHVRIDGPNGANVFEASSKAGLVDWVLDANLPDGSYNYDVWFTPAAALGHSDQQGEAGEVMHGKALAPALQTLYESGVFVIQGGILVPQPDSERDLNTDLSANQSAPNLLERVAITVLNVLVPTAAAEECSDPCTVTSATVPEFQLTNSTAGASDWELETFTNGTAFQIGTDAGDEYLRIEENAPQNSLYIENTGDIGFGTSTPAADLDIVDADPTIRFGETGTGGGAWTQHVLSGDMHFHGPAGSAEDVSFTDTGVGLGDASPEATLDIQQTSGASVHVENTTTTVGDDVMFKLLNQSGKTRFSIRSGATSWTFDNDPTINSFSITRVGDDALTEFRVDGGGNGFFTGNVVANGILLTSSRALKTGFTQINEADLLAKLAQLDITKWRYKSEPSSAEHIGPMAEQFQAVFGMGDGKHLEMVDTTGITIAAIQALVAENQMLKADNTAQRTTLATQRTAIDGLRSDVANLLKAVAEITTSR